jgi:hypothetical protein
MYVCVCQNVCACVSYVMRWLGIWDTYIGHIYSYGTYI